MIIVKEIELFLLNVVNGELFFVFEEIVMFYKDDIFFLRFE